MQTRIIFFFSLLLAQAAPVFADAASAPASAAREYEIRQTQLLNDGVKLVKERHPQEALDQYFDKVIAAYESTYRAGAKTVYCARSAPESLLYLAQAAADKQEAMVVGPAWCDAYFLRAYALIDLGRHAQARAALETAMRMAPNNAHYASECANFYRREKKWDEALVRFEAAAALARDFSPFQSRAIELAEALRGKGFVLVELGRLREAESIYKQCLEINAADKAALGELGYVQARIRQAKF